jgi:ERCC4-type nuclease
VGKRWGGKALLMGQLVMAQEVERMGIIIDVNEPKDIIKTLTEAGVVREVKDLPFGDYWIEGTTEISPLVIERKTIEDFLGALRTRRIFNQLSGIKSFDGVEPRLLLEGDYYRLKFYKWTEMSVSAILWAIENEWNIKVEHARSKKWTISWLVKWAKQREGTLEKRDRVYPIRFTPKKGELWEIQRGLVEGLPGISGKLAEDLLEHFKTPLRLFNASREELQQVPLIGEKKAEEIRKVLETEYKKGGDENASG